MAMAMQSKRAGRPRVFPRILLFGAATAAMIAAAVNDVPGVLLGAVGLGWVGTLFALVQATQADEASGDSGGGDGGESVDADGNGTDGGGGGDGGGGE